MNLMGAVKAKYEDRKKKVWNGRIEIIMTIEDAVVLVDTYNNDKKIELHRAHFFQDWEIYKEEDDWNLADEIKKAFEHYKAGYGESDENAYKYDLRQVIEKVIREHIQKVKEDVDKRQDKGDISLSELNEIIDKRTGDLK